MQQLEPQSKPWWRETQVLWLILLVGGIYFTRIADQNLIGEETRRAQVSAEMLWSGDWLVPHQQGKIYLTRPPLGNWVIAITAKCRGRLDAVSVRLPTLLAVLFTTLLIYGYARNFLSKTGSLLAAASYPTMAQVLQLGRVAESEGLFTLFISASLLVWHWGYLKKWPTWVMWSSGYFLAALAGLTKGPQGIIYFVGPVGFYVLVIERNYRLLFSRAHVLGCLVGAATIAAWQVPYMLATSWETGIAVWFRQASNRFEYSNGGTIVLHLVRFPFEILLCTFPWSMAFLHFFNKNFWRSIPNIRSEVTFLLVAIAVTFPTVWFAPFARGRYFMPMYPLMAVLCGLIVERCALAVKGSWMNRGWLQCVLGHSTAAVVGGVVVCALAFNPNLLSQPVGISPGLAIAFLSVSLCIAVWMFRNFRSQTARTIQTATLCLAVIFGFAYTGLILSAQTAEQPQVEELLSEVRTQIPKDVTLVSFGQITHAFAYHYGTFIPQEPWPSDADGITLHEYFCCLKTDLEKNPLPFAWEEIAVMSFEDDENPSRPSFVLVARRVPEMASAKRTTRKLH